MKHARGTGDYPSRCLLAFTAGFFATLIFPSVDRAGAACGRCGAVCSLFPGGNPAVRSSRGYLPGLLGRELGDPVDSLRRMVSRSGRLLGGGFCVRGRLSVFGGSSGGIAAKGPRSGRRPPLAPSAYRLSGKRHVGHRHGADFYGPFEIAWQTAP